ncbi:MAG: hypothetical protein ACR2QF_07615 [Geminicoccaceae bacterium]
MPIIALWCHPRSMSTAIERIMRERGDCTCFHEPFLYDYYIARQVRCLPHFQTDKDQPTSYEDIRDHLLDVAADATVFIKDMSYYVVPRLLQDHDFADQITHSFLIRDPLRSILSYYKLDPLVTLEEIGLEAQWRHVRWLEDTTGETPLIMEAEDVQQAPKAMMAAYWSRLGLPFMPKALEWKSADMPKDWKVVSGWHEMVSQSQTIQVSSAKEEAEARAAFDVLLKTAPHLADFLSHHLPSYRELRRRAIKPG